MKNNENPSINPLQTITADTLLKTDYPPLTFNIEKILPQGIFILAGSGKIGKSWLSLDMCVSIAKGEKFWEFDTNCGEVLYLALEDTHSRLQNRLNQVLDGTEISEKLHFAISSLGISNGLIEQIKSFISTYPSIKLIIIDTLERVRNTEMDKSMYSCDYQDMTKLREVLDGNDLTLLLVHHTRKMSDADPLNTLSGSTGLVGSVDGIWVLEKERRTENKAKLTIANRDTEGFCFKVEFDKDNCKWNFLGDYEKSQDDGWIRL